ncbi:MAG: SPOR domain-containing protein, partial [Pseudohongiella sp.]|nr:SPOR domain-containing protein [Pseudohongiella sp.]
MDQDFAKRRIRTPLAEPSAVPQPSSLGLLLTGLITGIAVGLFIGLLVYLSGALPPAPGQAAAPANRQIETPEIAGSDTAGGITQEQQREAQRLQLEFYQELPNYEVVVDVTPVRGSVPRTPPVVATAATVNTTTNPIQADSETAGLETGDTGADALIPAIEPDTSAVVASSNTLDPVSAALLEISNRPAATVDVNQVAAQAPPAGPSYMLQAGAFQQRETANSQLSRLLGLGLNARIREETLPGRTLFLVQAGPYASRDDMMQAERVLRSNSIDSM